jgi:hypothetical protein
MGDVMMMASSGSSWLAHTGWLVPLAALISSVAAFGTVVVAVYIGRQAQKVSAAQKEIAGLAEVNKISERLNSRRYLSARRGVANGFLNNSVEQSCAYELLDFMEEVSIYESNNFIGIDTLGALYSAKFICWWYATEHLIKPYQDSVDDPLMWTGTQKLIIDLYIACAPGAPAWATRPSDAVMKTFFEGELKMVGAAERLLDYG